MQRIKMIAIGFQVHAYYEGSMGFNAGRPRWGRWKWEGLAVLWEANAEGGGRRAGVSSIREADEEGVGDGWLSNIMGDESILEISTNFKTQIMVK